MNVLEQTFALLVTPPGNLVYYLVVLFSLSGALWLSWSRWLDDRFPQQKRAIGGLLFLIIIQMALFVISALGWQGILNLPVFLPPLQRAVSLLTLIWATWLWLFPEPSSTGDSLTIIASVLVLAGGLLSLANWSETPAGMSYNLTLQASLWGWVTLAWLALCGLLMLLRRPNGWSYGIAFVTLAFLGQLLTLLLERRGDYPGGLRLTELAAYPLLLALSSRFPARQATPSPMPRLTTTKSTEGAAPAVERRRYSADPKTVHALLEISADPQGAKFHINLARAVSQVMLADLCFVIYLGEEGRQLVFAGGYDLIREEAIEGATLARDALPMLINALQRGRPLRLPASSTSADVRALSQLLGLEQAGHLLMVPIQDAEKEVFGGLLLLSPYSNRLWSTEDQTFLANIAKDLVPLLEQRKRSAALQEHQSQVTELRERLNELEIENRLLQEQVDTLKATVEEKQTAEAQAKEDAQALTRLLAEAQQALQQMQDENARLQLQLERRGTSDEVRQLESELRNALIEMARLQNQLGEAKAHILELEKALEHAPTTQFEEKAEVIAAIAQELRQPLSSLIGYTDLLLGESVGILGAMQRKFVERIKASIERMRSLVDDLIQITL
ncbi:MAG: histidine kinase dimerization/phospho-acceptor domain-containing protein, partial [Anaerolineales bacterium]